MPLRARTKHLAHQFVRLHAYFRSEFEQLRDFRRGINALETQSPAEINMTAIHEAGHAVLQLAFGLDLVAVSIIPDPRKETAGYVLCKKEVATDDLQMVGRQALVLRQAMVYYAGAEAVRQLIPTDPNPDAGATTDNRRASELIIHEIGGNAEYVDFLFSLARRRCALLVAHHQPEIRALAAALEEKLVLSGKVARKVFLQSLAKPLRPADELSDRSHVAWPSWRCGFPSLPAQDEPPWTTGLGGAEIYRGRHGETSKQS